jgi:hypothetical protein
MIFSILCATASPKTRLLPPGHRDRETDRRLAIEPVHRLRRVGISLLNCRDIGEAEELVIGKKIDALQIVDRVERSGHADREFFQTGLDNAGGRDRVLLL